MTPNPRQVTAPTFDPNPGEVADFELVLTPKMSAKWSKGHQPEFYRLMDLLYPLGCPKAILSKTFKEIVRGRPCSAYVGSLVQCMLVKSGFEKFGSLLVEIRPI